MPEHAAVAAAAPDAGSCAAGPPAPAPAADADTFPRLLVRNARRFGGRPAMREKNLGIWQTWTWREQLAEVTALSCGLHGLGATRGDRIAIIGDNRPRLYWAMVATQALGGIPVPVYQDSAAEEIRYVLDHARARFAVAENQEQVDKLLQVRDRCPHLQAVVYDDPRGMRHYRRPDLHDCTAVAGAGRDLARREPEFWAAEVARGRGDDAAVILYTSGTTGQPKGVVLSHAGLITMSAAACALDGLDETDQVLSYLPMAWVGDFVFSVGQCYTAGLCVACPESRDTVLADLRELGPTYFFAPPRVFESLLTTITIRMEDAGALKRGLFRRCMAHAGRVGSRILDGAPVPLADRLLYGLGDLLVYGPLRNALGFSRIRIGYTAGEAIGRDIFDFYRSLGINLKQLYGMTEASVFITVQPDGGIRPDTVGTAAPGVELRIAGDGEVQFRSPGAFREYYRDPGATAAARTAEGWVRTGDAGILGGDGHLRIVDRARDVGRLADGTLFAPKYLENKLRFFPDIMEAVAFGDGRAYAAALINIDLEALANWAERRGIAYGSYQELAARPEVLETVAGHVAQVNRDLAADEHLRGSQIRRFVVLHKQLDADDGELTRTRKVRRRFIAERYAALVEALYGGADRARIAVDVTFEDGRTGTLAAELRIVEAERFGPGRAAA